MFHGSPLQVDPDYIIPLLHGALLDTSDPMNASIDDSLNLGINTGKFNPTEIV